MEEKRYKVKRDNPCGADVKRHSTVTFVKDFGDGCFLVKDGFGRVWDIYKEDLEIK